MKILVKINILWFYFRKSRGRNLKGNLLPLPVTTTTILKILATPEKKPNLKLVIGLFWKKRRNIYVSAYPQFSRISPISQNITALYQALYLTIPTIYSPYTLDFWKD